MSSLSIILNRKILASFLPNQEAVKAFETLIKTVSVDTPASVDDLEMLSLITRSGNRENELSKRIEQLEQLIVRKDNLSEINQRLKNIETYLGI